MLGAQGGSTPPRPLLIDPSIKGNPLFGKPPCTGGACAPRLRAARASLADRKHAQNHRRRHG
eukprot:5998230-Lingulodinium_polyedra.AAC.1